ncbi:MAG: hypothetical protein ABW252_09440, partial [Polyangiales bacterium]
MATDPHSLRTARERTIATLSELFARDDLEVEEFERRLSVAHRADSESEIAAALSGLASVEPTAIVVARRAAPPLAHRPSSGTLLAVLGGTDRRGVWGVPEKLNVVAFMGGSTLDFREARLGPGITTVSVFAMMGGVHIIVPPTLAIDVGGVGIAGGFEHIARHPEHGEAEQLLVVRGLAMMGGVSVETRLVGEDRRDAKRRRRRERKQRRRQLKA